MAYGTKYILSFHNDLQELYEIYFDFLNFTGQAQPICGTNGGLIIRSTATDDQKLSYLLGSECLLQVMILAPLDATAQGFASPDISELVATYDNSLRITVYKDQNYTRCIFQGFVVVEDNSQPFLDPPYILNIRAVDGIGLLKGVDLVDTNLNPFTGAQSVIGWIAQILYKTDQTLNIRAFFNFFHSSFSESIGALEQMYINAITFQKAQNPPTNDPAIDVNALNEDDCYTALEKICRCLRCRLFMEDGVWMFVNLYEHANPEGYNYVEYALGAPSSGIIPTNVVARGNNLSFNVNIGLEEIIHPVQNDQMLYLKMAAQWIDLKYNYDQSENKICNQDLKETTPAQRQPANDEQIQSGILDPNWNPKNETLLINTIAYQTYCWQHWDSSGSATLYPQVSPAKAAFIRSCIDATGSEQLRNLVVQTPAPSYPNIGSITYLQASTFLLDQNDILQFSLDWRTRTTFPDYTSSGGGVAVASVRLLGVDGTRWALLTLGPTDPTSLCQWVQYHSDSDPTNMLTLGINQISSNSQWNSASWNQTTQPLAKCPVSGTVTIYLVVTNQGGARNGMEWWYKNIQVTVVPYLSGSYQQVKGDHNFASSTNHIKQTKSENVEISDSPKRYFKGALIASDGVSLLTASWHRKGVVESLRFTQIMARLYYANIWRMNQKIEGHFRGLVYINNQQISDVHPNGLLNNYYFVDGNYPTKRFILTSFEKDYTTARWRSVFVEITADANDSGWYVPTQELFQYLFN